MSSLRAMQVTHVIQPTCILPRICSKRHQFAFGRCCRQGEKLYWRWMSCNLFTKLMECGAWEFAVWLFVLRDRVQMRRSGVPCHSRTMMVVGSLTKLDFHRLARSPTGAEGISRESRAVPQHHLRGPFIHSGLCLLDG